MHHVSMWKYVISTMLFGVFFVSFYLGEHYFLMGLVLIAVALTYQIVAWRKQYGKTDVFILGTLGLLAIGICTFQLIIY